MGIYVKERSRRLMIILGLIALVSMLFSVCLSCAETHHHCNDEDCPICACINHCSETLRELSNGIALLVLVFFVSAAARGIKAFFICTGTLDTPVSLKVRLND